MPTTQRVLGAPRRAQAIIDRVAGMWQHLEPVPWHLLEYDRYVELQLAPSGNMKVRHRFPLPGHWTPDNPPKGFSMFSSFETT